MLIYKRDAYILALFFSSLLSIISMMSFNDCVCVLCSQGWFSLILEAWHDSTPNATEQIATSPYAGK